MKRLALALALTLGALSAVEIAAPGSIVSMAQAASTYRVVVKHNGEEVASNTYDNISDAIAQYNAWNNFYGSRAGYDVSIEVKENQGKDKQAQ